MSLHNALIGADLHGSKAFTGTGSPVGVRTPGVVGEEYFDLTARHLWVAYGLANTEWTDTGPGTPGLHAATHQHGGTDEVATATPAANAIPKADGSGTLNSWISAVTASFALSGTISPASIGANQDNYNPTGLASATVLRLTSSGAFNITSIVGGAAGRVLILHNIGANNITLTHDDGATGTAANRFALRGSTNIVITPNKVVAIQYDSTTQRWRAVGADDPYGSAANTICQGNDSRLSDARTPTAHSTSHKHGGSDEVATATPTANAIPKAGASGQLDAGWIPSSISVPVLSEDFITSNLTNGSIGDLNWRTTGNGTGNGINVTGVAGHPGVLSLNPGTVAAAGRRSLQCGQSTVSGGFQLSTSGLQNPIEVEWLIRVRGTVGSADLEMIVVGLCDAADDGTAGLVNNGIMIQFNPAASTAFRAAAVNGGASSFQAGTTVVALNTWYKVSIVFTDTGSGGSLQLKVNGVNEGSPVTTNFPTGTVLSLFAKIDGQGAGGTDPILDIDRVRVYQTVTP